MFNGSQTFTGYSVDNLDAAETFYSDTLGLSVERTEEGLSIKTKSQDLFLYQKDDHAPATFTVLNFMVDDIDAAVAKLSDAGIALERYDGMHQDGDGIMRGNEAGMGPDIAWFKDPAGNILSVLSGDE